MKENCILNTFIQDKEKQIFFKEKGKKEIVPIFTLLF